MSITSEQLAQMQNEHRLAMAAVLNELATFVRSRENSSRAMQESAKRSGHKSRAKTLKDQLEVWSAVRTKLAELRTEHNVLSLGNRVLAMSNFCDRNVGDPTPAEIAKACEEFQTGWTESERQRRRGGEPEAYEVPRLKVDHMLR